MAIDDKLVTLGDLKTVIDNTHDSTKQDTLTFDTTPTQGSTNPVTSGGIYTGLDSKVDKENGKSLSTNDFTDADKQKLAELSQYVGAGIIFDTASGSVASFSDGGDGLPVKSVSVNVDPVQDTSGGAPSPTNICPITGHTSAAITRVGKNLFDVGNSLDDDWFASIRDGTGLDNSVAIEDRVTAIFSRTDGSIKVTNYNNLGYRWLSKFVSLKQNTNYRISFNVIQSGSFRLVGLNYLTNGTVGTTIALNVGAFNSGNYKYWMLSFYPSNLSINSVQIELGSTATTFKPYQGGHVYNITFPGAAGTVYGGTLDLNAGRLTVDKANIASYSGQSINTPWLSSMDEYAVGRMPTAGAQVVYPLTTPITYNFTAEEITTLLGINHIWADTGDVTVEYAADPKLYINKVIANALNA